MSTVSLYIKDLLLRISLVDSELLDAQVWRDVIPDGCAI